MESLINQVDSFLGDFFGLNVPNMRLADAVEIIIIAFFIYHILIWFKNTRTWSIFRGVLVVILFFIVATFFQMGTILWLGERLLNVAFIMIIVVFQPELRKALDDLGRRNLFSFIAQFGMGRGVIKLFDDKTLKDLVMASYEMGAVKTGALIVVENQMRLDEVERTGIRLDAEVTRQLLINIFEKNTPLHDGAVLIRGDRVVTATCYLPLSENMNLNKALGTRHRAAIGISEISDALTIVVSEETGHVSIAKNGQIMEDVTEEELRKQLEELQMPVGSASEKEDANEQVDSEN